MFATSAVFDDVPMTMTDTLRVQSACVLAVRLTWQVDLDHHHPEHSHTCAEDEAMAATIGRTAAMMAPAGISLVCVEVSDSGGRKGPWVALDLAGGWLSGPCT